MKGSQRTLWQNHKLLILGFLAALLLTVYLFLRLVADVVYWPQHRDAEISGWMTIGYVAHSYNVDKDALTEALDIETDIRRHLTLKSIADMQETTLPDLRDRMLTTIATERSDQ